MLNCKGIALAGSEKWVEANQAHDQALACIAGVSQDRFSDLVTDLTKWRGPDRTWSPGSGEAMPAFDEIARQFGLDVHPDAAEGAATSLLGKAAVLDRMGKPLYEGEFSLLLLCLARAKELLPDFIEVLPQFVARVGADRALELVQASPAAPLLLPLVTALQQELGQASQVAREVDEVAGDVRLELAKQALGDKQEWLCAGCGIDISVKMQAQVDHIVPVSRGGTNDFENLQLLCHQCNVRKGAKSSGRKPAVQQVSLYSNSQRVTQ